MNTSTILMVVASSGVLYGVRAPSLDRDRTPPCAVSGKSRDESVRFRCYVCVWHRARHDLQILAGGKRKSGLWLLSHPSLPGRRSFLSSLFCHIPLVSAETSSKINISKTSMMLEWKVINKGCITAFKAITNCTIERKSIICWIYLMKMSYLS